MIKLIDILNEIEDQPLTDDQFKAAFKVEVEKGLGKYDSTLPAEILADTEALTTRADILKYLAGKMDKLKGTPKQAYVIQLLKNCNRDFKPLWDFSKMKTIKKY